MSSDGAGYDHLETIVAARAAPRRPTALPRLVLDALRLAYASGRRTFLVTVFGQLIGAALAGAQVALAAVVLRQVIQAGGDGRELRGAYLPLALLAFASAFTSVSASLLVNRERLLGELVTRHVWKRILRVTGSVRLEEFESSAFYDRLQRIETHALTQPLLLAQALVRLLGGGAGVIVLLVALLRLEPLLVPMLAVSGVPLVYFSRRSSRMEFGFTVAQTPAFRTRHYLRTLLLGRDQAKEIRAYQLADALATRQDALQATYLADLRHHLSRKTRLLLAGSVASGLATALTLGLLVLLIDRGRLSVAHAGAALLAVRLLATRLQTVLNGVGQVFESGLFLADLDAFLKTGPPERAAAVTGPALAPFRVLTAVGLSFRYPGADRDAVAQIDLTIRRGDVIAVVGENGSGKSTLARLLAGLYAPTGGSLTWDDTDLQDLDPHDVRAVTAVMFQDYVRYRLSAQHNVGLGRVEHLEDTAAARVAAAKAGVESVLADLPRGYDTILSREFSGGRDLSGGQWQRVALARAFFREAPFVILDEPSAALDPRAENDLFLRLRELFAGRTVVYVSHRFSTVRQADRILVMSRGRVTEAGSHDELIALQGHYAELFAMQADAYGARLPPERA